MIDIAWRTNDDFLLIYNPFDSFPGNRLCPIGHFEYQLLLSCIPNDRLREWVLRRRFEGSNEGEVFLIHG
ncbi:MAG: hypothetical protein UY76_C0034G0006 [Candidatus Uhrbacteria bacterium GW2011_GWA2_52_8d]|uniref:Uncharacterized protein n=1 Tax=Candidatus Uhrbacteria bacterium GW2011_GWA2_52_8d TaxID=1618979 RepID=A0A0G2AI77_9BACT|nr:MAG: hypothetical protein UY76_C0034G0006 [Candidatus Uhrbacteria bacterium GW2011_GWA2_52_8d]